MKFEYEVLTTTFVGLSSLTFITLSLLVMLKTLPQSTTHKDKWMFRIEPASTAALPSLIWTDFSKETGMASLIKYNGHVHTTPIKPASLPMRLRSAGPSGPYRQRGGTAAAPQQRGEMRYWDSTPSYKYFVPRQRGAGRYDRHALAAWRVATCDSTQLPPTTTSIILIVPMQVTFQQLKPQNNNYIQNCRY